MPTVDELPTPCLLLDRARLRRNLARMRERVAGAGLDLRPHLKTAKSDVIARLATDGFSGAITVSTLAEARYFAERGFADILYGVGIAPRKLDDVLALRRAGADVHVLCDAPETAHAIAAAAAADDAGLSAFVEIDSGQARAGYVPGDPGIVDVARILASAPGVAFRGVLTHPGHSYRCRGAEEVRVVAEGERAALLAAAGAIRDAGIACPVVSAGSTPTAACGERFEGLTELRPGVYMFMDVDQAGIGACTLDDVAISVLATVIGRSAARGTVLVDAGGLALSKDVSALGHTPWAGYGVVADAPVPQMAVTGVSQEHGIVSAPGGPLPLDALPVGSRLRILPHHACFTAAAYERYHVVDSDADGGREVVDVWERVNGW